MKTDDVLANSNPTINPTLNTVVFALSHFTCVISLSMQPRFPGSVCLNTADHRRLPQITR